MRVALNRRRLAGQIVENEQLERQDVRHAIANNSVWTNVNAKACDFSSGNFSGARFDRCTFLDCDFRQSILVASFMQCRFINGNFDDCAFVAAEIRECAFMDGRAQYASFERATVISSRLGLNLHGARLDFAEGREVDWTGANLWNALIPLGCAMFAGSAIDERQGAMYLALIGETTGGISAENRQKLAEMIQGPHGRAVMRLVRGQP